MNDWNAWIKELKAGDLVIVTAGWDGDDICRVDRVTPSGRICIGNQQFNSDGSLRGRQSYSRVGLKRPTPENLAKAEWERSAAKLSRTDWHKLDLNTLRRVAALVGVKVVPDEPSDGE